MTGQRNSSASRRPIWGATVGLALAIGSSAQADVVKMRSGGELRGKIFKPSSDAVDVVVIETTTGAVVTAEKSAVLLVATRPPVMEEYETRLRAIEETPSSHVQLAEWCRRKGLLPQRTAHLQQALDLDSEFADAHRALGHEQRNGVWVDVEAEMQAQGYVRYKGRYVTPQELELLEKTKAELARETEWSGKVRAWTLALATGSPAKRQDALEGIRRIDDVDAAPAVARFMLSHASRDIRNLGIQVLAETGGKKAATCLAKSAVLDDDVNLRDSAARGIAAEHRAAAWPYLMQQLKKSETEIVARAAIALAIVGDEACVASLIEAMDVREPRRAVGGAPRMTPSFAYDPLTGPTGDRYIDFDPLRASALQGEWQRAETAAAYRKAYIAARQQEAVRDALIQLTGQNFGFDQRMWRLWHSAYRNGQSPS